MNRVNALTAFRTLLWLNLLSPLALATGCSDAGSVAADSGTGASPDVGHDASERETSDPAPDAEADMASIPDATTATDVTGDTQGRPMLLQRVAAIIAPNCAVSGCHDAITKEHGMDLSTAEGIYAGFVNQRGLDHCRNTTLPRVVPGNPNGSYVMTKITATMKACELWDPMPPPPKQLLTAEQIESIRSWILAGARRDDP
jgi:hypothetical protein